MEDDYLVIDGEKKSIEEWRVLYSKLKAIFGDKDYVPYYPWYYPKYPTFPPYDITWTDGTAVYSAGSTVVKK